MRAPSWRINTTKAAVSRLLVLVSLLTMVAFVFMGGGASAEGTFEAATEEQGTEVDAEAGDGQSTEERDAQLRLGAEVYSTFCASCHQAGGVGMAGAAPPLADNPHVLDTDYMTGVITNGLKGEIVVNGETYNGVMPSFSTFEADELEAVIVYVQSGFATPSANEAAFAESTGPVAGTELPEFTNVGFWMVALIAVGIAAGVLGPRLTSANSRLDMPWLDTWLKVVAIVCGSIVLIVFIPNWALQHNVVAKLSRPAQDLIGVTLWGGGLVVFLGALWYAHRESRI